MRKSLLFAFFLFFAASAQAGKFSKCEYKKKLRGVMNDVVLSMFTPADVTASEAGFSVLANLKVGSLFSGGGSCVGIGANKIRCGFECDSGHIDLTLEKDGVIGLEAKTARLSHILPFGCSNVKASDFIGVKKIILDHPVCEFVDEIDL